jgi:putative tryptophan/tyrosine transport system substrate-binding protein
MSCCRDQSSGCTWVAAVLVALLLHHVSFAFAAEKSEEPFRIGVLNEARGSNHPTVEGLKAGLRELGFEEGREVVFDIRFTQGDPKAILGDAEQLVKRGMNVIFTSSEAPTRAVKAATQTIPIVFTLIGDPVASGIVESLARPGANVTGISSLATPLAGKRLEILRMLAPTVRRVWAIHDAGDPASIAAVKNAAVVATKLGITLLPRGVSSRAELAQTIRSVQPGDGLLAPDAGVLEVPQLLLEASLASRAPAVFSASLYVGHGGLVSYGADYYAQGFQAARLVARILRGTPPQDLPVEGSNRIDLAVNLKTAGTFGITVPTKVLLRANTLRR